jgi:selenide, water dikinase
MYQKKQQDPSWNPPELTDS